jgi:hypothetical protein
MKPSGDVLRARDWVVTPTHHSVVLRCLGVWHYAKGGPNTSVYRHGMYPALEPWGDPFGVTLWLPPTRAAAEHTAGEDWRGVLSLSRLAIDPDLPTNAASFLLGASMRLLDRRRWPVLITYADTARGHDGGIYKATNWRNDGPVPAGDTWVDSSGRQIASEVGEISACSRCKERGSLERPQPRRSGSCTI